METAILRALRSNWVTRASTFSPTEKRSGRWSPRSRADLVALDEGGKRRARDLHLDAAVLDLENLAGHRRTLAQVALAVLADLLDGERIVGELLDPDGDALLLDIDVQHLGFNRVAFLVVLDRLLAGPIPIEIGEMDHPVDVGVEADEQPKLGLVLDLTLDDRADRMLLGEGLRRVLQGLLEAKRDAALGGVDLEHLNLDLLAGRDDLARVDVLLGPGHFRDVDETLDAGLDSTKAP